MASKRFLMVPEDSSAARMPLPGVTMATATLLSSVRFIGQFSRTESALAAKIDGSRANEEVYVRRRGENCWTCSALPRPACGERSDRIARCDPGEGDSPRVLFGTDYAEAAPCICIRAYLCDGSD